MSKYKQQQQQQQSSHGEHKMNRALKVLEEAEALGMQQTCPK
jgi:hypothetical protein